MRAEPGLPHVHLFGCQIWNLHPQFGSQRLNVTCKTAHTHTCMQFSHVCMNTFASRSGWKSKTNRFKAHKHTPNSSKCESGGEIKSIIRKNKLNVMNGTFYTTGRKKKSHSKTTTQRSLSSFNYCSNLNKQRTLTAPWTGLTRTSLQWPKIKPEPSETVNKAAYPRPAKSETRFPRAAAAETQRGKHFDLCCSDDAEWQRQNSENIMKGVTEVLVFQHQLGNLSVTLSWL